MTAPGKYIARIDCPKCGRGWLCSARELARLASRCPVCKGPTDTRRPTAKDLKGAENPSRQPRFKAPFRMRRHPGPGALWDVVDARGKTVVGKESYGFVSRFIEVGPDIGEVEEVREAAERASNPSRPQRGTRGKRTTMPAIRWTGTPPPRAWQDAHYRAAAARKDIADPIAFVKWTWERRLSSRARAAAVKNPFVSDDQIRRAYRFYKNFMRRPADRRTFVEIPKPPRVCVLLGEVAQISYTTRRDGDTEAIEYYHRFKHPRPRLATDEDGKRLFLAGGAYKVTKDGIKG